MTKPALLVLVIGPLDNRERVARVTKALRRKTALIVVEDSELIAGCKKRRHWRSRLLAALAGQLPDQERMEGIKASVVIVPRQDGTFGEGVRSDMFQAQQVGVDIKVVRGDGTLIALEEAGMALESRRKSKKGKEAQKAFRQIAGRFFVEKSPEEVESGQVIEVTG